MICVLLSSFNGEKYIRRQIQSILDQENVEVFILVRDDGSTDDTVKIIGQMQEKNRNIALIKGNNIGYIDSFYYLLKNNQVSAQYYAFSDQDDLWMPNKLSCAIDHLQCNKPALYGSNLFIRDIASDESNEGKTFNVMTGDTLLYSSKAQIDKLFIRQYYYLNNPYGCTMVWNRKLQEVIERLDNRYHLTQDRYLNIVANNCGDVFIDPQAYIIHLIHRNNTAGVKPDSLLNKLKKYYRYYFVKNNTSQTIEMCKYIIEEFGTSDECIKTIANCKTSLYGKFKAINAIQRSSIVPEEKRKYIALILFDKI